MISFGVADISVARLLYEDSEFMTVEIAKDDNATMTEDPEDGDIIYFLLFIKKTPTGDIAVVKPWEDE